MDTIKIKQLTNIYAYSDSFRISIDIFKFQTFIVGKNKMFFFLLLAYRYQTYDLSECVVSKCDSTHFKENTEGYFATS